ncbi:MAG: rhomboid family intramembrane serine protease [Dehalococcoidales bacterium]|jgi:membrane associated rhomboid family serine protease
MNPIIIIIFINLVVFLAVQISPQLIDSLSLPPTFDRPWAVITSMFVHAGFFHIFANMFTLYFFGSYLYRLLGERRFLLIYLGGGILGSIFFILLTPSSSLSAIGASGAVFALGGALVALRPSIKVFIFPIPVALPLWVAVIGGFFIFLFISGIAWQAHLGGLILGLVAGYRLKKGSGYYY